MVVNNMKACGEITLTLKFSYDVKEFMVFSI